MKLKETSFWAWAWGLTFLLIHINFAGFSLGVGDWKFSGHYTEFLFCFFPEKALPFHSNPPVNEQYSPASPILNINPDFDPVIRKNQWQQLPWQPHFKVEICFSLTVLRLLHVNIFWLHWTKWETCPISWLAWTSSPVKAENKIMIFCWWLRLSSEFENWKSHFIII